MRLSDIGWWLSNYYHNLWWRLMPGTVIKVKWPVGQVAVGPSHRDGWAGIGEYFEYIESADPNDHYRPWMEQNVGTQGWDWDWDIRAEDFPENRLTIRFRRGKEQQAVIAALRWS